MKTKTHLLLAMMMLVCFQLFAQQKIYVSTNNAEELYTVDLATCSYQLLGPSGVQFLDIAVTSNGQLWGIADPGYLYKVDTLNGAATFIGIMGFPGNALVELNDSTLLMAGGKNLYRVNVATGSATFIGVTGYLSAGDLTWYDNDLYLLSTYGAARLLVKIQLNSTNTVILSSNPVNNTSNQIPQIYGAITAPFTSETNAIVGFSGRAAYKICPFNASYQLLCDSIIPPLMYVGGAASVRLPTQNPLPDSCGIYVPTAINEFSSLESFQINPNPATTKIVIRNLTADNYEVAIYDLTGKKIFQSQISDRTSQTDIDVSQLNVGVYVLQIHTTNSIDTKKFVVAR